MALFRAIVDLYIVGVRLKIYIRIGEMRRWLGSRRG
jgi:hypothetical protein